MATPANDNRSLLELAIDVSTDIHKLATALHGAGAQPEIVNKIQAVGGMFSDMAKQLGQGPVGATEQPGAAEAAAAPGPGPEAPAGPPAAPAGPPQGAMPGERPNGLHEAAAGLQAKLASAHAKAQNDLAGAVQH